MYLINGQAKENLSVRDRGLHYGDGLFETIAILEGKPLCWDKHIDRLLQGCERLGIKSPEKDVLQSETNQLCSDTDRGVLKIIITRGESDRGYKVPAASVVPTRIVISNPWPDYPDRKVTQGVAARICKTRLGKNSQLAGVKHLNRLEQVLARNEWDSPDIAEGLMLDSDDNVIEGTMSNVFIISDNNLLTPDLSQCGVQGIIRQCILDLASELGIQAEVANIKLDEIYKADELFLSNSVLGIWPVDQLETHQFKSREYSSKIRKALIDTGSIVP
ncbi:MAG: aminodeoxychorismate lyase [Gammaproteobacteria bacterium]